MRTGRCAAHKVAAQLGAAELGILLHEGLDGLWDIAPGRGRKPTYQIDKIAAIVDPTLQTKPAGVTHWSCRTMAESQGRQQVHRQQYLACP